MPNYKLCTFRIGPCHVKVAIIKSSEWEELKEEYKGFDVEDVQYDQTEDEFQKRWPKGYVQRFQSPLRPHEMIIEEV